MVSLVTGGIEVSVSHGWGLPWDPPNMVTFIEVGSLFHENELIAAGPNGRVAVHLDTVRQGPLTPASSSRLW